MAVVAVAVIRHVNFLIEFSNSNILTCDSLKVACNTVINSLASRTVHAVYIIGYNMSKLRW